MKRSFWVATVASSFVLSHAPRAAEAPTTPVSGRTALNIVLILLDDVGFAAESTFGGPIKTPELDRLAETGLIYNNFNTLAICAPTRAALLTGRNSHRVGFGTLPESFASGGSPLPGYNTILPKSAALIPQVLQANGYETAAFGKWHLNPLRETTAVGPYDHWPTHLGFDYFYGFIQTDTTEYEPTLYRGTEPVEPSKTPTQGYHLTTDLVDHAIAWVHSQESLAPHRPYFVYFAPYATHAPHQVPKAWIARYRGQFDEGYDKLREEIFAREKALGVIPSYTDLTPRPVELPAWDTLSADQKKLLARQMEVYAGYLAQTDFEVGRLVRAVQQGPEGENTLILYIVGDNGPAPGGLEGTDNIYALRQSTVEEQLGHADGLGSPRYENSSASGWAWMMATPFQWMKTIASHFGGTRDPLVISWPARIRGHRQIRSQFAHVTDIAPTLYEAAGIQFPRSFDGVEQLSLDGTSLVYSFDHPNAPSHHRSQYFELHGTRAMYKDGWVAATRHGLVPWIRSTYGNRDYTHDRWELYHLSEDFSEAHDLAAQKPAKLKELQVLFDIEARKNNVYPLGAFLMPSRTLPEPQSIVYYSDMPRMPADGPDFLRSHRLVTELTIPKRGAEGVILTKGSRYGGFVLYVKRGHLVYENHAYNWPRDKIVSNEPLPVGGVQVSYEFTRDKVLASKPGRIMDVSGRAVLRINGRVVGQARFAHVGGSAFDFGSIGVGRSYASPVSEAYDVPFAFTGQLKDIVVTFN